MRAGCENLRLQLVGCKINLVCTVIFFNVYQRMFGCQVVLVLRMRVAGYFLHVFSKKNKKCLFCLKQGPFTVIVWVLF